jgi:hypothetical protein
MLTLENYSSILQIFSGRPAASKLCTDKAGFVRFLQVATTQGRTRHQWEQRKRSNPPKCTDLISDLQYSTAHFEFLRPSEANLAPWSRGCLISIRLFWLHPLPAVCIALRAARQCGSAERLVMFKFCRYYDLRYCSFTIEMQLEYYRLIGFTMVWLCWVFILEEFFSPR